MSQGSHHMNIKTKLYIGLY